MDTLRCLNISKVILPAVRINIAKQLDSRYDLRQKEIAGKLGVAQVAVSIALNKYEGITSAVCHDADEARSAKSQEVNAIVIKYSNIDEADAIVNAFAKGMGMQLKIKLPDVQLPQIKMQREEVQVQRKQQDLEERDALMGWWYIGL